MRADSAREPDTNRRRGIAWILASFGLLLAGLVAGTIVYVWRRELAWIAPLVFSIAYILAFRRGMLLWNPHVDRTWRQYLWLDRGNTAGAGAPEAADEDPERTMKIVHREVRPSRPDLRVIR